MREGHEVITGERVKLAGGRGLVLGVRGKEVLLMSDVVSVHPRPFVFYFH